MFDVIVIGLGAMGSSAFYHLANAKAKVLGIDKFTPPHDNGSSHGETRLIRKAYFEHSDYVPLLNRAYDLWEKIEKESGRRIFNKTGVTIFGPEGSNILGGIKEAASTHKIDIVEKCPSDFPHPFRVDENWRVITEPTGGYLLVDDAIESHLHLAQKKGGTIKGNCQVHSWSADEQGVCVRTNDGEFRAKKLVITGGAWSSGLLGFPHQSLSVHRVPLFWYNTPKDWNYQECFALDTNEGFFYGFSPINGLLKLSLHLAGEKTDPDKLCKAVNQEESDAIRNVVGKYLGQTLEPIKSSVCMYTMTSDSHFIIDQHPAKKNVTYACGFSGHGFKFASVIGEVLKELCLEGKSSQPIEFLRHQRT